MIPSPAQLAETHAAAFQDRRSWSAEEFSKLLQSPGVILCGDARSFLVGRVILTEAEVLTVATTPENQRQGLAQRHLRSFLDAAAERGVDYVFLEVADTNAPAKHLYCKEGFSESGRREGYYRALDGTKSDALTMQLTLPK